MVLHSFPFLDPADGRWPEATLVQDGAGNLYGTTYLGGANDAGTVFKLERTGKLTLLHSFCNESNCTDGVGPGALIRDDAGNLYGTAGRGANQAGLVFKVSP